MTTKQREVRHIMGRTWEWEADSGARYQLFWNADTGRMLLGIRRSEDGQWFNTTCTLADGSARRFDNVKDARAWAKSFVEGDDDGQV